MGKVTMIGDEMDLKGGPMDMRQDSFSHGTIQETGSQADLNAGTTPLGVFDKHVRDGGGKLTMIGDEMEMDRTPHRGWESASTPISKNSLGVDSKQSSYPK